MADASSNSFPRVIMKKHIIQTISRVALIMAWVAMDGCAASNGKYSPSQVELPHDRIGRTAIVAICACDRGVGIYDNYLIVAIWPTGRIIWSQDRFRGGPPYYRSVISLSDIDRLFARLNEIRFFDNPILEQYRSFVGVDYSYALLVAHRGNMSQQLMSWHEIAEHSGNLIATHQGIEPLGGRSYDEVWRKQPPSYRMYRHIWAEARQAIEDLIPTDGQQVPDYKFRLERVHTGIR